MTQAKTLLLTALHEIIRDGKKGEREVISPKTVFLAEDQAQYDTFLKAQAAREPSAGEAAGAKIDAESPEKKDLSEMTAAELKVEATTRELTFANNISKPDLLKLITDFDAKKDESLV